MAVRHVRTPAAETGRSLTSPPALPHPRKTWCPRWYSRLRARRRSVGQAKGFRKIPIAAARACAARTLRIASARFIMEGYSSRGDRPKVRRQIVIETNVEVHRGKPRRVARRTCQSSRPQSPSRAGPSRAGTVLPWESSQLCITPRQLGPMRKRSPHVTLMRQPWRP